MNKQQQQSLELIEGQLLLIAGAGSGKTKVITNKIIHLLNHLKPDNIFAMTFTNKAASEMRDRISDLLKNKSISSRLNISTFHSFGLSFLKEEISSLGYLKNISLFDEDDSFQILKNLIETSYEGKNDIYFISNKIHNWKNNFFLPKQVLEDAKDDGEVFDALIYKEYVKALQICNAVDFDDLILLPCLLLNNFEDIRLKWQQKIQYLLIDEYQDTNLCQYQLMKLLIGENGNLTVVGDDDQSIYAFRGAKPENIISLKTDYINLKILKLEQNYRCSGAILHCANEIIKNNPHIFHKKLWSNHSFGEKISLLETENELDEAKTIVDLISNLKSKNTKLNDIAILYRSNYQAKYFELELNKNAIEYQITGSMSFFDLQEIKDFISYLRVIVNPKDNNALIRILNIPKRGIGLSTLNKIIIYANTRNLGLFEVIHEIGLKIQIDEKIYKKLYNFYQILEESKIKIENNFKEGSLFLLEQIKYFSYLEQNAYSVSGYERKRKNLLGFIDNLYSREDKLIDIVNKLMLKEILQIKNNEQNHNFVQLMTLHASKGLEFNNVFIVGLEQGILPHQSSIEGGFVEEERRLLYVGVTRAKKKLYLTFTKKRKVQGQIVSTIESQFLKELPDDVIDRKNYLKEKVDGDLVLKEMMKILNS